MSKQDKNSPEQWDKLLSNETYLSDFGHIDLMRIEQAGEWWSGEEAVLNVGSGQGYLERQFTKAGKLENTKWTAVDISLKGLERIKELHPKVSVVEASVLQLPFSQDEFKLTYCMEVLEHIGPELIEQAYSELKRVTSEKMVISVPVYERRPLKESPVGHLRKLTPELIEAELEENGLTIIDKRYLFAFSKQFYRLKSLVSDRLLLRRPNVAMYLCQA